MLKAYVRYFLFFHQMIALQKLWKMLSRFSFVMVMQLTSSLNSLFWKKKKNAHVLLVFFKRLAYVKIYPLNACKLNWSELHILTELLVISRSSYQCHNKCPKPLAVYTHANKFHQVLVFFLQNYKMIESWVCSWEYFHCSWMNLITTHASQQLDSSKLSKFVLLLI